MKNQGLSPYGRLAYYAEQIARIHSQRPFLARIMMSESAQPTSYGGQIIEKHLSQVYGFIRTALQDGIQSGEFQKDLHVDFSAISLAGILNFYFIARPLLKKLTPAANEENAEAAYTAHAFHIYLNGIKAQK